MYIYILLGSSRSDREPNNSIPQEPNYLPPPRHLLFDFLVLGCTFECFHEWDVFELHNAGPFEELPDAVRGEDEANITVLVSNWGPVSAHCSYTTHRYDETKDTADQLPSCARRAVTVDVAV